MAKLGAKKAVKARMEKISPKRSRAIPSNAAKARWAKRKKKRSK